MKLNFYWMVGAGTSFFAVLNFAGVFAPTTEQIKITTTSGGVYTFSVPKKAKIGYTKKKIIVFSSTETVPSEENALFKLELKSPPHKVEVNGREWQPIQPVPQTPTLPTINI